MTSCCCCPTEERGEQSEVLMDLELLRFNYRTVMMSPLVHTSKDRRFLIIPVEVRISVASLASD